MGAWEQPTFPLALPFDILYNEVAVIEAFITGGIHPTLDLIPDR